MHHLSKWLPVLSSGVVVALVGFANVGCDAVDCGTGTIEQNGTCVPADDQPGSAQCGPGTVLGASGKCEPEVVVVCDPDTTREEVDPETGEITCVGTGTQTGCAADLPCSEPSAGRLTICGRLYDTQTDQPIQAAGATGAPCTATTADGPCSLRIQFFDALQFAMGPTSTPELTPAGGLTVDDCGRYRAIDLPPSSFTFMGIAVDDASGAPDRYKLTGVALPDAEALPARGFRAYATRNQTDTAWTSTSGISGQSFATRGVLAAVFHYRELPVSGVQARRNSQPITADDFYFTDTTAMRDTVSPAGGQAITGANGTALIINAPSPTNHDGAGAEPAGCQWPNSLAASIPGVVFVQIKEARTAGGVICP